MVKTNTIAVGDCFSSYKELEERVKAYEKSRHVQLTHRDSRTLEASRKRVPKRVEKLTKIWCIIVSTLPVSLGARNTPRRAQESGISNGEKMSANTSNYYKWLLVQ